jgi:hypothetical protein
MNAAAIGYTSIGIYEVRPEDPEIREFPVLFFIYATTIYYVLTYSPYSRAVFFVRGPLIELNLCNKFYIALHLYILSQLENYYLRIVPKFCFVLVSKC